MLMMWSLQIARAWAGLVHHKAKARLADFRKLLHLVLKIIKTWLPFRNLPFKIANSKLRSQNLELIFPESHSTRSKIFSRLIKICPFEPSGPAPDLQVKITIDNVTSPKRSVYCIESLSCNTKRAQWWFHKAFPLDGFRIANSLLEMLAWRWHIFTDTYL
jgi:hypothetical protein